MLLLLYGMRYVNILYRIDADADDMNRSTRLLKTHPKTSKRQKYGAMLINGWLVTDEPDNSISH